MREKRGERGDGKGEGKEGIEGEGREGQGKAKEGTSKETLIHLRSWRSEG